MSDNSVIDLDNIFSLFEEHEVFANPSEIHGAITGLLAGGLPITDKDWIGPLSDFYHQGLTFPTPVMQVLELMFKSVWEALNDEDLSFALLLPEDEAPLADRSTALSAWTQGFMLGFGTNKDVLKDASDDVNEVIQDFSQISKMELDVDQSEENESAYFEIYEYVRISAVMCFSELGAHSTTKRDKITLH